MFLSTSTSVSRSCVAVVQVSDPEGVALVYQYQNEPFANAASTMHMHYGTAMLRMSHRKQTWLEPITRDAIEEPSAKFLAAKPPNKNVRAGHVDPNSRYSISLR